MQDSAKVVKIQWVIIVVILIVTGLLIYQNIHLKFFHDFPTGTEKKSKSLLFQDTLKERFLFKKFPLDLEVEKLYFREQHQRDFVNSYLIMAFDLTVCGKCLYDQLEVLKRFQEKLEDKNIYILAVTGIVRKNEESQLISMHSNGDIFFPFKTIQVEDLYNVFKLSKERFIDTPFYVYTSHQFQVLDIFKPEYLETKGFEKWLKILTAQDAF